MALTGSIETLDGVTHDNAYAKIYPVQTEKRAGKNYFFFALHVWHDKAAHDAGKKELEQVDLPRNFELTDEATIAGLIVESYEFIKSGNPATPEDIINLMVSSQVVPAENYILALPDFASWVRV